MFPSPNEESASGGRKVPPKVDSVVGGTSSPGLTGVKCSCNIGGPPSSHLLWVLHCVWGVSTMGFGPRVQEGPNVRQFGIGMCGRSARVATSMRVLLLTSQKRSCKTRPSPWWWVPREIPPTIKLVSVRRVKSDISYSGVETSILLIEVE
ncbi:hypothetical protein B296_00033523 [Ensete ventricosum]|uniref:Uncharacterized protein n=1 Tax=Ensete ventricosum TaxID=4639 RepID=A0A426XG13_ENSVE|nr:hypothetical protein B296_00033523 [Ensete ventricosum]